MTGKVSAREDSANIMVTCGPDVCLTPIGGGMEPVGYNSVAILKPSQRLSTSVFNNKKMDFQLNTRSALIKGHEPGTGRGVNVSGYLTYSHVKTASSTVFSEGWAVARDQDPAWINHPDVGPTEPKRDLIQLAATTTNFKHACKTLGIDPIDASAALHAAKNAAGLGGADNCVFDLGSGDISHNGESIGNLGD